MRVALALAVVTGLVTAAAAAPRAKKVAKRVPGSLVLVIDRSGSMQGPKLEAAKDAAIASVKVLAATDQITIITFDSEAKVFISTSRAADRARISTEIAKLQAGGGTSFRPALARAHEVLQQSTLATKHVILMSDGESPDEGVLELVKTMKADKITVSTVAVTGANEAFLDEISKVGGGRAYALDDITTLVPTFVKETRLAIR